MDRPIGYWIKRLDAALELLLDSVLARLNLTRRQWQVINTLSSGPVSPADIKDILSPFNAADAGNAQERDLAALVRKGLVFVLDGRLSLTDAGVALHSKAAGLVEGSRHALMAGIGTDEYAMAVSVLERMSNNADRLAAR